MVLVLSLLEKLPFLLRKILNQSLQLLIIANRLSDSGLEVLRDVELTSLALLALHQVHTRMGLALGATTAWLSTFDLPDRQRAPQ